MCLQSNDTILRYGMYAMNEEEDAVRLSPNTFYLFFNLNCVNLGNIKEEEEIPDQEKTPLQAIPDVNTKFHGDQRTIPSFERVALEI